MQENMADLLGLRCLKFLKFLTSQVQNNGRKGWKHIKSAAYLTTPYITLQGGPRLSKNTTSFSWSVESFSS